MGYLGLELMSDQNAIEVWEVEHIEAAPAPVSDDTQGANDEQF